MIMPEAKVKKSGGKEATEVQGLEFIYQTMNLAVPGKAVDLAQYKNTEALAASKANERMSAALSVFIDSVLDSTQTVEKIDKVMLDHHIAELDRKLSLQLDEIMHHPNFQKMESSWRSLKFLVDRTDFKKNIKIDIIDASKDEVATDFEDSPEIIQSGLYKHVYTSEYDTPGGEPYSALISNFDFDSGPTDINLLQNVSKVSAACHCPFLGSVSPKFFGKQTIQDLTKIEDLHNYMEKSEFVPSDRGFPLCWFDAAAFHAPAALWPGYDTGQGFQLRRKC
jgi:type VI secretion system protein ImpC